MGLSATELNDLIGDKWMGWWFGPDKRWHVRDNIVRELQDWFPSTNPAHAGEARRKAADATVRHSLAEGGCFIDLSVEIAGVLTHGFCGACYYSETNGDKGKAEALATCRAIVAVTKAALVAKAKP